MTRPPKDMTKTMITREHLLALLQGDDALRALLETTVQQVLEAEMEEALGAGKGERTGERRGSSQRHTAGGTPLPRLRLLPRPLAE